MAQLTLPELEKWLWDSANILRGHVDSSDYKNYIFGLMFFKRINDVFEDEVKAHLAENPSDTVEDAYEYTTIKVPTEHRWSTIYASTSNLGAKIDKAMEAIEHENRDLGLSGVLTNVSFNNPTVMTDTVLQQLLRHFNQMRLGNGDLSHPNLLGDAYEYLIKQFADDSGKKGGEFYTPKSVVQLIVKLIKPEPRQSIYDPTCGSGGMLVETAKAIEVQEGGRLESRINAEFYGQEKNAGTWAIAKLNLLLHNLPTHNIAHGDTLVNPQHKSVSGSGVRTFDRVIANPPFSMSKWWSPIEGSEDSSPNYSRDVSDPYGRFVYGVPPRSYGDLAFVQHMIASLNDLGRMGVVLPHGILFRGGEEEKIRKALLATDWVEGVIGLPQKLFYNASIPACILVINKFKDRALDNKVIVIDASGEYKEGKNQNILLPEHIKAIADMYEARVEVEGKMRIVDLNSEILGANEGNLNISRYITSNTAEEAIDIPKVLEHLAILEDKEKDISAELNGYLRELGY